MRSSLRIVVALLIATLALASTGCSGSSPVETVDRGSDESSALTPDQRRRADQFVSVFENDTIEIQYSYVENIDDGRGYTAGRAGFTTATGDVLLVVEKYTAAVPRNALAEFLPRLRQLSEAESDSTVGLEGFADAWTAAASDPVFRRAQDSITDELYYLPAVAHWQRLGLRAPLVLAAIYDAIVQHGEGDDPDGLPALLERATARAGGSPGSGVDESDWASAFLDVRRATLSFATDPDTREGWAQSVDRVDAMRKILEEGNLDLKGPIRIETPNHQAVIP